MAKHYLGIGTSLCINKEFQKGESYFIKAFKIYPNIKKDKKLLSRYYFSIGVSLCSNAYFKRGRNYLAKAVGIYPNNTKYLLVILVSFLGHKFFHRVVKIYQRLRK